MATARQTTDHSAIRKWVEARGGHPARVKATGSKKDPGVLRIDYPGYRGKDTLEEISWDEFFQWFDRNELAFLRADGPRTRFSKFVKRASTGSAGRATRTKSSAGTRTSAKATSKTSSKRVMPSATSRKSPSKAAAKASRKTASSRSTSTRKAGTRKATSARRPAPTTSRTTTKRKATRTAASTAAAVTTTDHAKIRRWVEARGGFPAHVKRTGRSKDPGVLRIDYPGFSGGKSLERMDWDAWFRAFDRNKLAFLYQNKRNSRFSKLIER